MQAAKPNAKRPSTAARFRSFCCDVNISMSYCFPLQHLMYDDPPHTAEPAKALVACVGIACTLQALHSPFLENFNCLNITTPLSKTPFIFLKRFGDF